MVQSTVIYCRGRWMREQEGSGQSKIGTYLGWVCWLGAERCKRKNTRCTDKLERALAGTLRQQSVKSHLFVLSRWSNDHLADREMLSSMMAEGMAEDWLSQSLPVAFDERFEDGNSRPVQEEKVPSIRAPYWNDVQKKSFSRRSECISQERII